MNKLFFFLALIISASQVSGQMFFDIGVKGAYGPTVIFNQEIFDSGAYKHEITTGYAYGGKFGFNFNGQNGITLDVMSQTSKQDFLYDGPFQNDISNNMEWKHTDLILMYRYTASGAFIEFGPKLSLLNEVSHSFAGMPVADASGSYTDQYLSGVFGFGSSILGTELASLQLGIRLHFAIDDMVNESGKLAGFPTPGFDLNNGKTLATAAMLNLEFNYAFGRFAKTECSGRWKLILFE